jgi:hypothetical protein
MIKISIDDAAVKRLIDSLPKSAVRAAEIALDQTVKAIRNEIRDEMRRVFDRPVPWTLNSLQITPTRNHNLQASVWFKDPERMQQHYLVPQVEGGARKLKGLERAIAARSGVQMELVPGAGAKLDRYGNVARGQVMQIMSVLKVSERWSGHQSDVTRRSASRGKERDYVLIPRQRGKLIPGIYRRVARGSSTLRGRYSSLDGKTKGRAGGAYSWQVGRRKKLAVRARGLQPILLRGTTGNPVRPLLDFYGIAEQVYNERFQRLFHAKLRQLLA